MYTRHKPRPRSVYVCVCAARTPVCTCSARVCVCSVFATVLVLLVRKACAKLMCLRVDCGVCVCVCGCTYFLCGRGWVACRLRLPALLQASNIMDFFTQYIYFLKLIFLQRAHISFFCVVAAASRGCCVLLYCKKHFFMLLYIIRKIKLQKTKAMFQI